MVDECIKRKLYYDENAPFFFFKKDALFDQSYKAIFTAKLIADSKIEYEWSSSEKYVKVAKATVFKDKHCVEMMLKTDDRHELDRLERCIKGFSPHDWNRVKFDVAVQGNYEKFKQNPELCNEVCKLALSSPVHTFFCFTRCLINKKILKN